MHYFPCNLCAETAQRIWGRIPARRAQAQTPISRVRSAGLASWGVGGRGMKAGWLAKPFEDCIEKVTYTAKIQRKDFLDEGEFPIVSQEESFINGYWNDAADVFNVPTPVVIFGDHTKVLKYVDFDFVLGADGVKLLPPKAFLLPKFFYYQLQSVNLDSLGYARHYKLLRELELRYPPLPEQQRIVTLLDEAFDGIATARANAEQNLQNARAIFESHLQSVFTQQGDGWISTTIGNSCILKSGTTVPVSIEKSSGDIPYVKVAEMTLPDNQDGITTSIRFLNRADVKAGWLIPAGAVIFPKRGGAILTNKKRLALVDMCADLNIMSVIPTAKLTPEFLYFYFLTVDMRKLGTGSSIPQINNYDIAPLEIAFPDSTRKQAEIADSIRSLESECQALESIYHRKIAALDDLKKSLLHQAFAGLL